MDYYFELDEHDRVVRVRRDPLPRECDARVVPLGFSQRRGKPALPSDEVLVVATGHRRIGTRRRDRAAVLFGDGVTIACLGSFVTLIDRRRDRQLIVDSGNVSSTGESEVGFLRSFHRGKEVGVYPDVMLPLGPDGLDGRSVLPDWREAAVWLAIHQLEIEISFWREGLGAANSTHGFSAEDRRRALQTAELRFERYRGWAPNRAERS